MAEHPPPHQPAPPPRRLAVALDWSAGADTAPEVVAAGRGAVAEQILALAFAHGVRVREDADLAEMLAALDLGAEIPLEAFAVVAEILVYVYRANGQLPPPALAAGSVADAAAAGSADDAAAEASAA